MSVTNLNSFVEYVWSFYGEHDDTIYPIKGLTKDDILDAFKVYRKRIQEAESNNGLWFNVTYQWGGGDSLDRERVRDIILDQPQFTWSH
tara:strand:- start:639 stop:905 length:267 start_codon:yes stop_codon:yes gene_type:complete